MIGSVLHLHLIKTEDSEVKDLTLSLNLKFSIRLTFKQVALMITET